MLAVLVLIFILLTIFVVRKISTFYNPLTIFIYSLFIYRFSVALNFMFFGNNRDIPYDLLVQNFFLIDTFLIGLIIPNFRFISAGYDLRENLSIIKLRKSYINILYFILFFGLVLYFIFLFKVYGSLSNILVFKRAEFFFKKKGLGFLEFGTYFILIGFSGLFLCHLLRHNRFVFRKDKILFISFLGYISFFLITGERGEIIKLLLPIIGAYSLIRGIPRKIVLIFVPLGIFIMHFISIIRGYPLDQINLQVINEVYNTKNLNPTEGGELIASTNVDIAILNELSNNRLELKYGASYIEAILNIFPDFIFSKQELLSEWYVRTYNPEVYAKGGGLAFSIIAEGIVNFGYFGGFIGGIVTGFFMSLILKLMKNKDFPFFNILIGLITLSFCLVLQRSGISTIMKIYLFSLVIPLLFLKHFFIQYEKKR